MRPMDKATADSLSVQSFAIIKNTGHGNFVIGGFHTRARNGLSVGDWPVHSPPLPHRHPFSDSDFFWGEGAAVHRLSETNNRSSNCPSKLTNRVRWIVHSKLKPFPFQIKTYYLSDANHQTDNPSQLNNPSLGWKRSFLLYMNVPPPPLPWVGRSRDCFCFFTKTIFKLTIDISMRKKRITSYYPETGVLPEMILRPLFCLEETKKYRFINI